METHYEDLGRELNEHDGRTDGADIAKALRDGLDKNERDWFYDRVYHWYDDVPLDRNAQITVEMRSRKEIGPFLAMEAAAYAKCNGLTKDERWFLEWLAKVTYIVPKEAGNKGLEHLPDYWQKSLENRRQDFTFRMEFALPKKPRSTDWLRWNIPVLTSFAAATVASAFGDENGAASARKEAQKIASEIDADIGNAQVARSWLAAVSEVNDLLEQRCKVLPGHLKDWQWIIELHLSATRVVQIAFASPHDDEYLRNLANLFGGAFVDRIRAPSPQDVQTICSACSCGSAAINVSSEYPIEVTHGLLRRIAALYDKPKDYLENWLQFTMKAREDIRKADNTFAETLGIRVCLEILLAFGMVDIQASVPVNVLGGWSRYWLNIVIEITKMTKEKLPGEPAPTRTPIVGKTLPPPTTPQGTGCLVLFAVLCGAAGAALQLLGYL